MDLVDESLHGLKCLLSPLKLLAQAEYGSKNLGALGALVVQKVGRLGG